MNKAFAAALTAVLLLCRAGGTVAAETIAEDTDWYGKVSVRGVLVVEKGATLTVAPGTVVCFEKAEPDEEGLAQSGLLVKGRIIARGADGGRISFTSGSASPAPGDWGEVKIFESPGSEFASCDFSFGGWGIHAHDSELTVTDCSFTENSFGGLRGKGGEVLIADSSFRGMDIGVRYWQGSPSLRGCTITGNTTGIFFRKDCEGANVHKNNIYGNREYDLKLGDAQEADIDVSGNWWGTSDVSEIRKKIFDRSREDYIGRALIEPVLESDIGGR